MRIPELEEMVRIDGDDAHSFKPFVEIKNRIADLVMAEFTGVRADARSINPPIIIYEHGFMEREIAPAAEASLPTESSSFGMFAFHPDTDVIIGSDREIERRIGCLAGVKELNLILAEELIHAQSTSSVRSGTRVGYMEYPFIRALNRLVPGAVYDATGVQRSAGIREPGVDVVSEEYKKSVLLTERVTQLVIYGMMHKIRPDVLLEGAQVMLGTEDLSNIVFRNKRAMLEKAKRSLYRGDLQILLDCYPNSRKFEQMLEYDGLLGVYLETPKFVKEFFGKSI